MSLWRSCIYTGEVVHKRLRPKAHALRYRVFAACLDVDEIDRLAKSLPGFARNTRQWLSFYDADHGAQPVVPVGDGVRALLANAGLPGHEQIQLLCYPRMLGYVFNPLSVYFCSDGAGVLRTIVYEVNNTFGERTAYVIPVPEGQTATISQSCAKGMAVSPFTNGVGSYGFRIRPPAETVLVGVSFRDADGPVIKTHFRGDRETLSSRSVGSLLARYPLMTLKVIGGIHWEAARLFSKRVPLVRRQKGPPYQVRFAAPTHEGSMHVS